MKYFAPVIRSLILFIAHVLVYAVMAQPYVPGQVYFSAGGYVEYRCGDLPLVISVPHGGALVPNDIPDRTCNDPVFAVDANTVELGYAIDSVYAAHEGCRPHVVICHLARRKLDANRDLEDGACGDPQAVQAWSDFHAYIESAKEQVSASAGKGFYLDLHGHGHTVQRLELGYLLYEDELALDDATLNTSTYIDYSSIRALALTNELGLSHASLLRGPQALGTRLADRGYPAVPSQQDPFPLAGQPYFSGGYNTVRHSSYQGGSIDGVQVECNFAGVRDNALNRARFADSLRVAMNVFLGDHYFGQRPSCAVSVVEVVQRPFYSLWPNPSDSFVSVRVQGSGEVLAVEVLDGCGRVVAQGDTRSAIDIRSLAPGPYAVHVAGMGVRLLTKE